MIKRLQTKRDLEKKHKRNQWILGIVLVVVMFGSVFGVIVNSFGNDGETDSKIEYNGYNFQIENNYFTLEMGSSKFYFSNGPDAIDSIEKEVSISKILPDYNGKIIYLSSEDSYSSGELYQNLQNYIVRIQPACESEENCVDETFPIKTCEDEFIIIRESDENKIYQNQSCVYIEGKSEDLLKLTDEFLLHLLGIKQ